MSMAGRPCCHGICFRIHGQKYLNDSKLPVVEVFHERNARANARWDFGSSSFLIAMGGIALTTRNVVVIGIWHKDSMRCCL